MSPLCASPFGCRGSVAWGPASPSCAGFGGGGGPPVAGRGAVWEEAGVLPGLESWVGEIGAGSPLNWVDLWVRKAFRVP